MYVHNFSRDSKAIYKVNSTFHEISFILIFNFTNKKLYIYVFDLNV